MGPRSRSYQASATPVTIFAHLIVIAVTILVLVWLLHFREGLSFNSHNKNKIFNLHPLFMIIGFILIGGEAIMAYKSVPSAKRETQKGLHLALQTIALVAGILGVYAAFKYHNEIGLKDLYTLHSWLGIITICLFALQWLLGIFFYCFQGAEYSKRGSSQSLPWHVFVGMLIFLLAICTAQTGLVERFLFLGLWNGTEALIVNFTALLIVLFAVPVALAVILP